MSSNNLIGNRNSTPETSHSLRPPAVRAMGASHHLRASADMSGLPASPLSGQAIRPASEVYYNQAQRSQSQVTGDDAVDKAAQKWIADIEQNETTLEEMAAATLDQDFKDELGAIEQWFKVLTEPERTAALYALVQQTTQVQIRFFIQVLQEMAKSHPMAGILSPANFGEKDAMSKRFSDAAGKLSVDHSRNSIGRPPPSPGAKRNSVLDASTINAMFPDAANAIAKKKAEYTQQTGNPAPSSNRNSANVGGDRTSLAAPTISAPNDLSKENNATQATTPWNQRSNDRPASASGPQTQKMGQFSQPPPSATIRSPRPSQLNPNANAGADHTSGAPGGTELPMLSPYQPTGSWASMSSTPMVPNFNTQPTQADMLANATAMKLAALSTVNNRIMLDDVRKYRRARSNEGTSGNKTGGMGVHGAVGLSPGLTPTSVLVVNESGQLVNSQLNASQLANLQLQQQQLAAAAAAGRRSPRPASPAMALGSGGLNPSLAGFTSPQNNGFLAAYDHSAGLPTGMSGLSLSGSMGMGMGMGGHEGYISDHSDMARGRSPRGRRGTSKPPEDPTDPALLADIPAWLRSLRLHKYTDNLKTMKWQDLVELDDKGLEDKGVNALGARRKMLKVFEQVKENRAEGKS